MHLTLEAKRISPDLTREQWEEIVRDIFQGVYNGQMGRILKTLRRDASAETIAAILSQQFYIEPAIVKLSVQKIYDELALSGGQAALDDYDLTADWEPIQENLFMLSRARSGWFARAMTETSQRQTQLIVRDWLATEGGTVQQLREQVQNVWIGPRPDAAATTETTYMFNKSRAVAGEAAGTWGYGILTRNDDRVRPSHAQAAAAGPYPWSDTEHLPPIYDDINCRCTIFIVKDSPNPNER